MQSELSGFGVVTASAPCCATAQAMRIAPRGRPGQPALAANDTALQEVTSGTYNCIGIDLGSAENNGLGETIDLL